MTEVSKHFVTFYSPGTLCAESNREPIDSWDVDTAVAMARSILQRHVATPYGFEFTTRSRGPEDLDSKVTSKSPFYWLGGTVETLDEVKARATDKDRTLISNMEGNGWKRIITNNNSYRWTQPLKDTDTVLDFAVTR